MPKGRPPTAAELARIQEFAPEATEDNVLVYKHLMVGDQIVPNRYMRLNTDKTLPKFAKDTKAGATWIFNHNWWDPTQFGTAFDSELVTESEMAQVEKAGKLVMEEVQARHLYGKFYMPKGLGLKKAPYPDTDSVARAIEMGILRDTSIGFRIDRYECNICGNDIRDWRKCEHFPGMVYELEIDGKQVKRMCIIDAQGGELFEQSSVFAGAYPVAGIVGQGTVSTSQPTDWESVPTEDLKCLPLDAQVFCTFSSRGGVNFYVPSGTKRTSDEERKAFSAAGAATVDKPAGDPEQQSEGGDLAPDQGAGDQPMAYGTSIEIGGRTIGLTVDTEALATLPDSIDLGAAIQLTAVSDAQAQIDEANAARDEAQATAQGALERATAAERQAEEAEQALSVAKERIRTALGLTPDQDPVAEVERLSADLQDTRTYREHLVTEAVAMGVRAYGNAFSAEKWEAYLRTPGRTLSELQNQFQAFEAETRKRFPTGRLSVPVDPPGSEPVQTMSAVPDSVYRTKR